jgi:hypothetical protein
MLDTELDLRHLALQALNFDFLSFLFMMTLLIFRNYSPRPCHVVSEPFGCSTPWKTSISNAISLRVACR